jgi:hypothetical protein
MRRSRWYLGVLATLTVPALGIATALPADAEAIRKAPAATYQPLSPNPCGTMSVDDGLPHQIDHVVWVVFENKARSTVFGDATKDPYLGGLALSCGQATAYQSTPFNGAKLAMASGTDWGITGDAAKVAGPDIYSQLGTDWLQYMGGMPSNCFPGNTKDKSYFDRHNAPVFFTDAATACKTQDVPLPASPGQLDLSHAFTYIEANVPQSMHGCAKICGKNKWSQLALGDAWARTWVTGLTNTDQYRSGNTVIFVVWDQGGSATGSNTAFMAVSPYTTPGTVSTTAYTHYSLLRGTQELLGLPLLQHAADPTTNSVATAFGLPFPAVVPPTGSPAAARHRSTR